MEQGDGNQGEARQRETRLASATHEAATGVAGGGLLVSGLLEVVQEVESQLGANRHAPLEVRSDFILADLPFPERERDRASEILTLQTPKQIF